MTRSLKVRQNRIEIVKLAVRRNGFLNQRSLSEELGLALSTVSNFLTGKPVDRAVFSEVCDRLSLDWQDIAEIESFLEPVIAEAAPRQDWKEAPDISTFVGRNQELEVLRQWIVQDQCRLIAVLGLGGVGKTTLTVKLAEQAQSEFEYLIWRSLRNTPSIQHLLTGLILFLSNQQAIEQPNCLEEQISCLMEHLRQHRCLLVLDNLESILQSGDRSGCYVEGYEGYGQLLERISNERHRSCVVITSREKPMGTHWQEDQQGRVRTQRLTGLSASDGQAVLNLEGLLTDAEQRQLVAQYKGNPLALKIAASTIQSVFGGDGAEFLRQGTTVFGDIWELLDQQFNRLTQLQQQVMYWVAVNREPVTLTELREDLIFSMSSHELLGAVTALRERSLIETTAEGFTQQPVVMEYVTTKLIDQLGEEITTQALKLFQSHALLKAHSADYIRDAQTQLTLKPLASKLLNHFGSKYALEQHLKQILCTHQHTAPLQHGYVGGNLINLLCHLETDLTGYDFSNLQIRQAYLVGVTLHNANFTGCDFSQSVFSETLTATLSVAFSRDGNLFATGNADSIARVWQTKDSSRLVACKGHTSWVWAVAFSPDGQILATGSFDQTIRLWNAETGMPLKTLSGHTAWVWAVAFSPDGQLLASASNDHTVKLWDAVTGQCIKTFAQHTSGVNSAVFSPDGQILASSSNDRTIKFWNLQTGELLMSLEAHSHWVRSITFSPDGKTLISGSHDQTIKVWDLATWQCLRTLQGHTAFVLSIALSSDSSTLASGSHDCTVRVWDIATGECLKVLHGHPNGVWSVAFHPNGQRLVSGSNDSMVKVWDVKTGQSLKTLQGYCTGIRSIAFSSDGQRLLSGGDDKTVRLWDIQSGGVLQTLKGHTSWVWSVAFSPDQETIASSSNDSTIRLWNRHGKELCALRDHANLVMSIAFSPDGQLLVSGSVDQTIRLWNVESRQCVRSLMTSDRIWAVAFSPDGEIFASGSENAVQLWSVQSGECVAVLQGHRAIVFSLAFSPDGETIASGSSDQTVKLWNRQTGDDLHTLSHTSRVWAVAFSPDGTLLASTSEDQTVKLWNVQTGDCLQTFRSRTGEAWTVAFSPNGQTLATGEQNGMIHVWDVQTGALIKIVSNKRPYEQMKIARVTGLTPAQQDSLEALGASVTD